jgi:hypothetical protein
MSAISIQQMADRIASLMQDRLGARGTGLEAKLASCGRVLPRKVRHAAKAVAEAAAMAQNPKLLLQIDHATLAQNYDICLRHLMALKPYSGFWSGTLAVATSIAVSLLVLALLLIALLRWRGLI